MPLLPGKKNIGHNIEMEEEHGKPREQAIAISLHFAREHGTDIPAPKGKKGGQVAALKRKRNGPKEEIV